MGIGGRCYQDCVYLICRPNPVRAGCCVTAKLCNEPLRGFAIDIKVE